MDAKRQLVELEGEVKRLRELSTELENRVEDLSGRLYDLEANMVAMARASQAFIGRLGEAHDADAKYDPEP